MSKTIATHNSTYHADDAFAVATLLLIEPEAVVVRTRDAAVIGSADYVVDVGFEYDPKRKRFDHHQPGGAGARENGIQYASFGLVWKEYGERLSGGKREAAVIDRILAEPLDAHDNGQALAEYRFDGVKSYTIVEYLYSFLPKPHDTEENLYKIFMDVVALAKDLLIREIEKAKEAVVSEDAVLKIYEESDDKRIIILDKEYDWVGPLMKTPDAMFAVYPRNDGTWGVKGVPGSSKVYGTRRKDFPASWGGKQGEDIERESGVPGATFAHRGLFMCAAKTQEAAVELAKKALNS